jgi:hypothetical protein
MGKVINVVRMYESVQTEITNTIIQTFSFSNVSKIEERTYPLGWPVNLSHKMVILLMVPHD